MTQTAVKNASVFRRAALVVGFALVAAIFGIAVLALTPKGEQWMRGILFGPQEPCGGGDAIGADMGGPFTLTTHAGAPFTAEDLKGQPNLMYFGYGFCPDVCPTDLAVLGEASALLDQRGIEVQPIFITIDPQRDTPEFLAGFAPNFHPRMIALTGSEEAVDQASKAWRAYVSRPEDRSDPYYLVDHSALIYYVNAAGETSAFFPHNSVPEDVANGVACRIAQGV